MRRQDAFSLVEVTLAIGIVGFALLAILGMVPVGMRSARESIDATRTSLIAQAVADRIRANMVSNDPKSSAQFSPYPIGVASFFFFTAEGAETGELLRVQSTNNQPQFYANVTSPADFYRAKVTVQTFDQTIAYPPSDPRAAAAGAIPDLLCASVEIGWPVNTQTGSIISATTNAAKMTYTFVVRKP